MQDLGYLKLWVGLTVLGGGSLLRFRSVDLDVGFTEFRFFG